MAKQTNITSVNIGNIYRSYHRRLFRELYELGVELQPVESDNSCVDPDTDADVAVRMTEVFERVTRGWLTMLRDAGQVAALTIPPVYFSEDSVPDLCRGRSRGVWGNLPSDMWAHQRHHYDG